jgi:very-short-patch-repair endonuclease
MSRKKQQDPQAELRRARAAIQKEKHEGPFLRIWQEKHPELPQPVRDYKFAECVGRKFKIDFAFPELKLGVELDGGGARSRHATVKGYANDCDKNNLAIALGWRLTKFNVIHMKTMSKVVDFVADIVRSA